MEKRKQAAEEAKANRTKAREAADAEDAENSAILDNLLKELQAGGNVRNKGRRARPSATSRPSGPLKLNTDSILSTGNTGNETADIALNMLAQLKSNGFDALTPTSPTSVSAPRRPRRKRPSMSGFREITEEITGSPMLQDLSLTESELSVATTTEMSGGESTPEPEDIRLVTETAGAGVDGTGDQEH